MLFLSSTSTGSPFMPTFSASLRVRFTLNRSTAVSRLHFSMTMRWPLGSKNPRTSPFAFWPRVMCVAAPPVSLPLSSVRLPGMPLRSIMAPCRPVSRRSSDAGTTGVSASAAICTCLPPLDTARAISAASVLGVGSWMRRPLICRNSGPSFERFRPVAGNSRHARLSSLLAVLPRYEPSPLKR